MSTQTNGAPAVEANGKTEAKPGTAMATQAAAATVEIDSGGEIVRVGFDTLQGFKALQRIAQAFSVSNLVPETYQGKIANCIIAVEMATRMGASPLMVMQNLYLVHGRPGWSSQFLIASFNNCGRFSAIKYRWGGERGKPTWSCRAWAREKDTGETVEGPEVTMAMAKAEGWVDKKGSKWLTIPELMLTYRAATFLVRTTAPELTMGLRTADEQEDIGATPESLLPATTAPTQVDAPRIVPPATAAEEPTEQPKAEAAANPGQPAEPTNVPPTPAVEEAERPPTPSAAPPTPTEEQKVFDIVGKAETPEAFAAALAHIQNLNRAQQIEPRLALIRQIDLHLQKPGHQPTADLGKLLFRVVSGLPEDQRELGQKVYTRYKWAKGT